MKISRIIKLALVGIAIVSFSACEIVNEPDFMDATEKTGQSERTDTRTKD